KLKFSPAANANGAGYASFTFQVQDDGGTAHSGVDLDQSANTLTIDVTSVNDAPAGTNNTVSVLEDGSYTFAAADFGFTDPTDAASAAGANVLLAVEITTLPGAGSLTNNGVAVTAGQFVSAADITAGKLKFSPAANANGAGYASFTFQVQDDGGTAHSGVDLDQSANTLTIDVTSVNDAPTAAGSATLAAVNEDTAAPAGATVSSLFSGNFSDAADQVSGGSSANTFAGIAISNYTRDTAKGDWQYSTNGGSNWTTITTNATTTAALTLNASDLLRFVPAANYNGSATALSANLIESGLSITSGAPINLTGATGGATHISSATVALSETINSVNDAPLGANKSVTSPKNGSYTFTASDFGFSDPNDSPPNTLLA